jgi:hypothetical protein
MTSSYPTCPVCHSDDLELVGYEDGGGDYGDELTAVYQCGVCESITAQDDLSFAIDEEVPDEPEYFPQDEDWSWDRDEDGDQAPGFEVPTIDGDT